VSHLKDFNLENSQEFSQIPMKSEATYLKELEQAAPPTTPQAQIQLQKEMQLNYRQAIGELIYSYALVTCRPDISFPLIKLSQYSTNPAREHYKAIKFFKFKMYKNRRNLLLAKRT
jgi:hypothetical protein